MSEFNQADYLALIAEIDYLDYKISIMDGNDIAQAKELNFIYERYEFLSDLLNQWRAKERRNGFKLIIGGKNGG